MCCLYGDCETQISKARRQISERKRVIVGKLVCTVISLQLRRLNHFLLTLSIFVFDRLALNFRRRQTRVRQYVPYIGIEESNFS